MKWTRELPSQDGWYWFRSDKPRATDTLKCVPIEMHERLGPMMRDGRMPFTAKDWPGDWAGPIPTPEEP